MRTRSTSIATATAVLLGSVVLGISTATSASAATAVTTTSVGGLVADGPLQRVFVGDTTAGTVYAADRNGVKLGSIAGIAGVDSLAVSADGSTVYAASPTDHQIVAIDAATLVVEGRYAIDTNDGPVSVAFAAGKLWFSYGDQWDGNLGSVDSTGTVALAQMPQNDLWNPELLSASTTDPNELTGLTQGQSPSVARLFDLSSGTPQLENAVAAYGTGTPEFIEDVDLIPGGGGLLLDGYDRMSYSDSDSTYVQTGTYPAAGDGDTADISPSGLVAQVDNGSDVRIFRPNAAQPLRTYATGAASVQVAWDPDDSRVFALEQGRDSTGSPTGSYTLKVLTGPTLSVPTLSVKAPAKATRAKKLTVTGKISATVPLPAGVKLTVSRTDLDYPKGKALPSVTTGTGGTFSFSDTPTVGGTVTYTVAYPGDTTHTAVTTTAKVAVSRTTPKLTITNNGKHYAYGKKATYTVHLGSEYKNRTVSLYGDPYGTDQGKRLLKSAKVNSSGNLSVTVTMNRNWTLTTVYTGDEHTAPKTLTTHTYAYTRVSTTLSKQYRNARIGSTTYAWYHKKTSPVITTTMPYYKGRAERLDLQVYYQGHWYASDSEYFTLGTNGKAAVKLDAPNQSNIRARIRADYIETSSGDNHNATTYGTWKYIYFTN